MAEADRDIVAIVARSNRTHADVFTVAAVLLRPGGEEEAFFANALLLGRVDPLVRESLVPAVTERARAQCGWPYTHPTRRLMRDAFWAWLSARSAGAVVLADRGWPAATLLLSACLGDVPSRRASAPYPLHELATLELAAGMDPCGADARLLEPPQHRRGDPVCDARLAALVARRAIRLTTATASARRELEAARADAARVAVDRRCFADRVWCAMGVSVDPSAPPSEEDIVDEALKLRRAERLAFIATIQPQGDNVQ